MDESFLRLVEVTKRFGARRVVDRVSLDIAEGEIMALLGASGCGKTTTLRLIAGLEVPDEGEIWMAGERVAASGRNLLAPNARGIGFVFQDLALWPHLSVEDSLDFVLASSGMPKRKRAQRIADVLRLVRVEPFARSYPGNLSGGEQQRAALARAIVAFPRLLLLDEPMSGLDAHLKADLLCELTTLQRQLGVTTIYITHDRSEVIGLVNRVAIMHEGHIEQVGPAESLRTEPAGETVGGREAKGVTK